MSTLAKRFLFLGGTRHGQRLSVAPQPQLRLPVSEPLRAHSDDIFPKTMGSYVPTESYSLRPVAFGPGNDTQVYVNDGSDADTVLGQYIASVLMPQDADEPKDPTPVVENSITLVVQGRRVHWDTNAAVAGFVAQSLVQNLGPAQE